MPLTTKYDHLASIETINILKEHMPSHITNIKPLNHKDYTVRFYSWFALENTWLSWIGGVGIATESPEEALFITNLIALNLPFKAMKEALIARELGNHND